MGHPAYEARREAERAEAEEREAAAKAAKMMMETFADLMTGKASIQVSSNFDGPSHNGWNIRIVK